MEKTLRTVETQRFSACLCCRKKKCVKPKSCRKYNVHRLSNSGKRKRKKKRKSVNVITGKSLVEGEKENRKMIIEIALLVINEFTPE